MEQSQALQARAAAIRQFLSQHQPKLPEARGLLQFVLQKSEILARTELVGTLDGWRYGILISSKGSDAWPFLYRCGDRVIYRTAPAVLSLMKFVPSQLALCLVSDPPPWSPGRQEFAQTLARWQEELLTDEMALLVRRSELLRLIDEALARGDRSTFQDLTRQLQRLPAM